MREGGKERMGTREEDRTEAMSGQNRRDGTTYTTPVKVLIQFKHGQHDSLSHHITDRSALTALICLCAIVAFLGCRSLPFF